LEMEMDSMNPTKARMMAYGKRNVNSA